MQHLLRGPPGPLPSRRGELGPDEEDGEWVDFPADRDSSTNEVTAVSATVTPSTADAAGCVQQLPGRLGPQLRRVRPLPLIGYSLKVFSSAIAIWLSLSSVAPTRPASTCTRT